MYGQDLYQAVTMTGDKKEVDVSNLYVHAVWCVVWCLYCIIVLY